MGQTTPPIKQTVDDKEVTIVGASLTPDGNIIGYNATIEKADVFWLFVFWLMSKAMIIVAIPGDLPVVFLFGALLFGITSHELIKIYGS